MTQARYIILAGFILSTAFPNLVFAQSSCSCSIGSIATVTSISGEVTTSGADGFATGQLGQVLSAGSEVYTGAGSTANISYGPGCNFQINGHSKAVFANPLDTSILCAEVSLTGISEASTVPASTGAVGWGFVAGAVGLSVWGISELSDEEDDDTPTSP